MVKSDGDLTAIFPFQRLGHQFIVAGLEMFGMKFDPDKEKRSVDNIRQLILRMKSKVSSLVEGADATVLAKSQHYLRMLDVQLAVCDKQDRNIEMFRA
jgi:hypothetical protein